MNITQKTYKKNVKKFGVRTDKAFDKIMGFVKAHKLSDEDVDELCSVLDNYILINAEIDRYCLKNDINPNVFFHDVMNSCVERK